MKKLTLLIIWCIIYTQSQAQWTMQGPGGNRFGNSSTNLVPADTWRSFGIGDFNLNGDVPQATLQINKFYLLATPNFPAGNMIRTDGDETLDNTITMFTGATALTTTEKMRLFAAATTGDVTLQASVGNLNINTGGASQRMTILGSNGHAGIGLNHNPGNDILDILPDIGLPNTGLGINHQTVLHNNGFQTMCVGVGAGSSIVASLVIGENTFMGFNAGNLTTTGRCNTFIGKQAGEQNTVGGFNAYFGCLAGTNSTGSNNTFLGHHCGFQTTLGNANTFIGYHAGFGDVTFGGTGSNNTFCGYEAGDHFSTGQNNSFFGYDAGQFLTSGNENVMVGLLAGRFISTASNNVFVGTWAGLNTFTGLNNTFIGDRATNLVGTNLTNSSAIGSNTIVCNKDNMILGNNSVNVGIGLSNVPGGPLRKVQIQDDTNPQLRLSSTYNIALTNGTWTDFQTTSSGDLYIHPFNNADRRVGINTALPGNTLEINAIGNSTPNYGASLSGVRFNDLASTSPTAAAGTYNNLKFLTANTTGDIVLGDLPPGIGGVTACSSGLTQTNFLTKITGTNQICNTAIYENSTNDHDVGIGGTASIHNSRLYVRADAVATNGTQPVENAIYAHQVSTQTASLYQFAVKAENTGIRDGNNYNNWGGYFLASGSSGTNSTNFAVRGEAIGTNTTDYVDGGNFSASNGIRNYGVYTKATGGSTINYAIYSFASGTNAWAGYFNGPCFTPLGVFTPSDAAIKQNIEPITNASDLLNLLAAMSYNFDTVSTAGQLNLPSGTQYGFIAEEFVRQFPGLTKSVVVPEVLDSAGHVIKRSMTILTINYTGLIPFLVQAVQELSQHQAATDETLASCCTQPRTNGDAGTNKSTIELENLATLQLEQNDPNPFIESTYIRWNLSDEFKTAVLYFYDNSGSRINTFEIKTKGQGELQVFGSRLSSGTYSYTLVIDGKQIDTKKMVKTK